MAFGNWVVPVKENRQAQSTHKWMLIDMRSDYRMEVRKVV